MATNLTPDHLRCSVGGCPSVHELEDGRFLIVGKYPETGLADGIPEAEDEATIVISPDLLSTLKSRWIKEALEAAGVGQG